MCSYTVLFGEYYQKHSKGNARKDSTHMLHVFPTYSLLQST